MLFPELSETVFDAVYEVHRMLGPAWSQIYDLLVSYAWWFLNYTYRME
jgi:hypothetical protein